MVKIFNTLKEFSDYRQTLSVASVGVVPTMGNLHEGHLSLLKKSLIENDVTVFTIFVNPKQFSANEDLDKYPRTLEDDLKKISEMVGSKEVAVFAPKSNDEIYPTGFSTTISVGEITHRLEGKIRPTHFDGVTTVVYQLFQIIKPTNAYFGQKDFQQCVVIKKMVKDLFLPINITIMPIIRSAEGLALSSRNQYLSPQQKKDALLISQSLKEIARLVEQKKLYQELVKEKLSDKNWDYLEVLDTKYLEAVNSDSEEIVVVGAYRMGTTRLLDNIVVSIGKKLS